LGSGSSARTISEPRRGYGLLGALFFWVKCLNVVSLSLSLSRRCLCPLLRVVLIILDSPTYRHYHTTTPCILIVHNIVNVSRHLLYSFTVLHFLYQILLR
jgi:hypothetical protein